MEPYRELVQIVSNYGLARVLKRDSPASFWYTPDEPRVYDQYTLRIYSGLEQPFYLIDYRPKLSYSKINEDGIIALPYFDPVGTQVNPEAAFQYALGLHDEYLSRGEDEYLRRFLHYVEYFLDKQEVDGDWLYQFDWGKNSAPWGSALAQARGASVMLRAAMLTGEDRFRRSAELAVSKFDVSILSGGYLWKRSFAGQVVEYFEEYPKDPTSVLNGFMAALFGVYELGKWLGVSRATKLWDSGLQSLVKMLPAYTTDWWTLYDIPLDEACIDLNSVHYHRLTLSYQRVLIALSSGPEREALMYYLRKWEKDLTMRNQLRATTHKLLFRMREAARG